MDEAIKHLHKFPAWCDVDAWEALGSFLECKNFEQIPATVCDVGTREIAFGRVESILSLRFFTFMARMGRSIFFYYNVDKLFIVYLFKFCFAMFFFSDSIFGCE